MVAAFPPGDLLWVVGGRQMEGGWYRCFQGLLGPFHPVMPQREALWGFPEEGADVRVPRRNGLCRPTGSHIGELGLDGFYIGDEAQLLLRGPVVGTGNLAYSSGDRNIGTGRDTYNNFTLGRLGHGYHGSSHEKLGPIANVQPIQTKLYDASVRWTAKAYRTGDPCQNAVHVIPPIPSYTVITLQPALSLFTQPLTLSCMCYHVHSCERSYADSHACLVHVYIAPVLPATSVYSYHISSLYYSSQINTSFYHSLSLIARSSLDLRLTAHHIQTGYERGFCTMS